MWDVWNTQKYMRDTEHMRVSKPYSSYARLVLAQQQIVCKDAFFIVL